MSLYTIADLHLSTLASTNKSMEVFGHRWQDYTERLKTAWQRLVTAEDTVVIPGDVSWALTLDEAVSDLKFIGESAFEKVKYLKQIEFPNSLNEIEERAFYRCAALTNVTIPDTVTLLGVRTFSECISLESATIGNGVTEIPMALFSGSSSLKDVILGKYTESIGELAFSGTDINKLVIPRTVKEISLGVMGFGNMEYYFEGTKSEWLSICEQNKRLDPDNVVDEYTIHCSDGDLEFKRKR